MPYPLSGFMTVFGSAQPSGMTLYGRRSKLRLSRFSLIVAKEKDYCGSQVFQRRLQKRKNTWLLSSHLFYSLIVVTIDGEPQSLQGSSQRPSLLAARYPNAKQLLILPALQNGSGPNSCVESQYVVAVASFWLRLTIGTFATPFD